MSHISTNGCGGGGAAADDGQKHRLAPSRLTHSASVASGVGGVNGVGSAMKRAASITSCEAGTNGKSGTDLVRECESLMN